MDRNEMKKFIQNLKKHISEKRARSSRQTWQNRVRDRITPFLYNVVLPSTDHIIFAAHARCEGCKAGLGYRPSAGISGEWDCTNVLRGIAKADERNEDGKYKHPTFPFAFYSIHSEDQKSRTGGATTRPDDVKPSKWYLFWLALNDWSNKSRR